MLGHLGVELAVGNRDGVFLRLDVDDLVLDHPAQNALADARFDIRRERMALAAIAVEIAVGLVFEFFFGDRLVIDAGRHLGIRELVVAGEGSESGHNEAGVLHRAKAEHIAKSPLRGADTTFAALEGQAATFRV